MGSSTGILLLICFLSFALAENSKHGKHKACSKTLDLGIIMDASSSVKRRNYNKIKRFIRQMVDDFDVSEDGTHFGLIHYSNFARLDFSFNDEEYHKKNVLKAKIDTIIYSYGGTRTDRALNLARKRLFCKSCSRKDAKKVLLVITDGNTNPASESLEKVTKSMKEKHVVIMSLGIGSLISDDELHKIASEPQSKHVFHINSFDDLKSHISEIEASACGDHDLHDHNDIAE